MPIYEYQCEACGHRLESLQKVSDAPLTECPACGGKLPPLVKGMRSLVCEYCDTTVRI